MNQLEEESLYRSLDEEAIDLDGLLVEPRSDQVSVSGVWCYEEENLGKCIKTEDVPYNLDSNSIVEGVETRKFSALDALPHGVGLENFLATNAATTCEDYLLDIGYIEQHACIAFGSTEGLNVGSSSSESQFQVFRNGDKGSFGIQNPQTENHPECQNYFLSKTVCNIHHTYNCDCMFSTLSDSKPVDRFQDFSKSFIHQENRVDDDLPPHFAQNEMEVTPAPTSKDHDAAAVTHKRSRKPTKRYIDESSNQSLKTCKKRRETSVSKVKISGIRRPKHQNVVEPKEKMLSSEISFGKAIQVPFISQGPTECQKTNLPTMMETHIENYSMGSEDDSEAMMGSISGGIQRKHHRLWTVSEVKKLIDGVAHFGVGKWTHIKKLLFSSSVHRTPVDLKDKWRNLLKASRALKGSMIEDDQKRSQPWRPLPKSILCRVRELASAYPYPHPREREGDSKTCKSKFPIARHVSSPPRIRGNNKVSVL